MRIDKFLKVSRLIKRRSVAKEACESGRILLNGKTAKPSSEVAEDDILELKFMRGDLVVKVLKTKEHVGKAEAEELYSIIEQRRRQNHETQEEPGDI